MAFVQSSHEQEDLKRREHSLQRGPRERGERRKIDLWVNLILTDDGVYRDNPAETRTPWQEGTATTATFQPNQEPNPVFLGTLSRPPKQQIPKELGCHFE